MKRILLISLLVISAASGFIASGEATLSSAEGLDKIGFNFNTGSITGNEGDIYYLEDRLWTNNPAAGFKKMSGKVSSCDYEGYVQDISVSEGDVLCIKTQENSYARITILSQTSNSLTFNWEHQRDGTNLFVEESEEEVVNGLNINYFLIGVIALLIIIIILLWKFR